MKMLEEGKEPLEQLYAHPSSAVLPIFDAGKLVWGYEMSRRGNGEKGSDPDDAKDMATLSLIGTFLMNPTCDKSRKKAALLLPFSQTSVLEDMPPDLSYEPTAVILSEERARKEGVGQALAALKKQKYLVAIDKLVCMPGSEAVLRSADILFIDVCGKKWPEIARMVQKVLPLGAVLGAKGVESPEQFQAAKDLGFTLFHGGFFQKPEVTPGKKLHSSTLSRFRLCHLMTEEYPDLDELTKIIQSDVALSYRFLSFVNSAAFGFHQKIDSIKRAFVHIGWEKMKSWLWIMVIADLQPRGKSSELPYLSAVRGKFLETLATDQRKPGIEPDSLFLMGLFSLLEPMLDLPMKQILESLPLDDKIKAALCRESNLYSDWLETAKCFESGEWDRLDLLLEKLRLDSMKTASAYCKAIVWTKSFYTQSADEPKSRKIDSPLRERKGGSVEAPVPEARSEGSGGSPRKTSLLQSVWLFMHSWLLSGIGKKH